MRAVSGTPGGEGKPEGKVKKCKHLTNCAGKGSVPPVQPHAGKGGKGNLSNDHKRIADAPSPGASAGGAPARPPAGVKIHNALLSTDYYIEICACARAAYMEA